LNVLDACNTLAVDQEEDVSRLAKRNASTSSSWEEGLVFKYWHHVLLLSIESHCVITIRTIKLASGGTSALDEAWHILVEKTAATAEISHMLYTRSPLMLAVAYRKLVRSNLRRLSARHDESGCTSS
jgi:hypothetical protein